MKKQREKYDTTANTLVHLLLKRRGIVTASFSYFHIETLSAVVFFARTYTHARIHSHLTRDKQTEIRVWYTVCIWKERYTQQHIEHQFHSRCYCNTQQHSPSAYMSFSFVDMQNCFRFLLLVFQVYTKLTLTSTACIRARLLLCCCQAMTALIVVNVHSQQHLWINTWIWYTPALRMNINNRQINYFFLNRIRNFIYEIAIRIISSHRRIVAGNTKTWTKNFLLRNDIWFHIVNKSNFGSTKKIPEKKLERIYLFCLDIHEMEGSRKEGMRLMKVKLETRLQESEEKYKELRERLNVLRQNMTPDEIEEMEARRAAFKIEVYMSSVLFVTHDNNIS